MAFRASSKKRLRWYQRRRFFDDQICDAMSVGCFHLPEIDTTSLLTHID